MTKHSLSLVLLLLSSHALAFPEMVKKDYPNCTACHHSPTGGGVLTPYGRELSRELLSRWHRDEQESQFAYFVNTPESLSLGGDFRFIQTYKDTSTRRTAKYFMMQSDLEAAGRIDNFSVMGTAGISKAGTFLSRRHSLIYRPFESFSIRVGKFMPAFGINTADHVISIKRGLGFDQETETYNIEAAWIGESPGWGENLSAYLTAVGGRPDDESLGRERGVALQSGLFVSEAHKLGISYFFGSNTAFSRHLAGVFGIFALTPNIAFLSEWDFQTKNANPAQNKAGNTTGFVNYHKLDYELTQGLHAFMSQEFSQLDLLAHSSRSQTYSVGMQFFPRPHFELIAEWQKQKTTSLSAEFIDIALLLIHFYP